MTVSEEKMPPVCADGGAVNKSGVVRSQKYNAASDYFGRAQATGGDLCNGRFTGFFRECPDHIRTDIVWADDVCGDTMRAPLWASDLVIPRSPAFEAA